MAIVLSEHFVHLTRIILHSNIPFLSAIEQRVYQSGIKPASDQNHRLGTVSIELLGSGLNMFYWPNLTLRN